MKGILGFLALSRNEKQTAVRLFTYLLLAELQLAFLPYDSIRKIVFDSVEKYPPAQGEILESLKLHVKLLEAICRRLPWKPTCLRMAVALRNSLAGAGIRSSIKIGARKTNSSMQIHAWLECGGLEILKNGAFQKFI